MNTSKKILIGVGVFLLLLLITWGICETAGSDYYNYKGYVVDIVEENGDTVIVTLSGNVESRFTLKWYSREKYKKETKDIEIGDLVRLTTTQYSNTNIKKISVDYGYSVEGKIFYVETLSDRPFLFINELLYSGIIEASYCKTTDKRITVQRRNLRNYLIDSINFSKEFL